MPKTLATGQIVGIVTGTFYSFPYSLESDILLRPHPRNSGTAWIISENGAIGYPIRPGDLPLQINDIADMSTLRGWFEKAQDAICYLLVSEE